MRKQIAVTNSNDLVFFNSMNPNKYNTYELKSLGNIEEFPPDIYISTKDITTISNYSKIDRSLINFKFPNLKVIDHFRFSKKLFDLLFKKYDIPYLPTLTLDKSLFKESSFHNLFKNLKSDKVIFKPIFGARSLGIFTLEKDKVLEFLNIIIDFDKSAGNLQSKEISNDDETIIRIKEELSKKNICEFYGHEFKLNEGVKYYIDPFIKDNLDGYIIQPFVEVKKEYRVCIFRNYKDMDYNRVLIYERVISKTSDDLGELLFNDFIINFDKVSDMVENFKKLIYKLNEMTTDLGNLCLSMDIIKYGISNSENLAVLEIGNRFAFECSKGLIPDYLEESIESLY